MKQAPQTIGSATVILYAIVTNVATGNTTHIIGNQLIESFYGLAICQYNGEGGYYLFYCDESWEAITDTWHESVKDAQDQAEYEYRNINWIATPNLTK